MYRPFHRFGYRCIRLGMQVLQHQRPDLPGTAAAPGGGGQWVLKTPQHALMIPAIKVVFPDAVVVLTRRDPVAVLSSMLPLLAYSRGVQCDRVDLARHAPPSPHRRSPSAHTFVQLCSGALCLCPEKLSDPDEFLRSCATSINNVALLCNYRHGVVWTERLEEIILAQRRDGLRLFPDAIVAEQVFPAPRTADRPH